MQYCSPAKNIKHSDVVAFHAVLPWESRHMLVATYPRRVDLGRELTRIEARQTKS
jgi:hypothetical protein